ncbi:thioredoxin [Aureococcus anophagefferens]|nr:thioredoxin [Aureococcus anophagefferens]
MGRSFLQLLAALSAALSASLSAPRTCVVSDVAYGRVSGSLYKSFGGDLGAVHDVVAVAGTDEAGDDHQRTCSRRSTSPPGSRRRAALARGALVTVLGSTDAALAATQALAALGSAPRVVTARRGGVSDAMDRGAAEACHPAALAADDDGEENDYFEGQEDAFAGSVVLDFAGDEGNRASYASCLDPDVRTALDWGLARAVGGDAYAEAFGWPNDGETRKRLALDVCVPSVALVDFGAIDDALRDEFAWDEDVEDVDDLDADPVGDAVVFVTAKFCNSCRRLEPHYARLQRASTVDFLRVDATRDRSFAAKHGITSTPTFLLYKGGVRVATVGDVVADDDEARDRRGLPRVKS